MTFPLRGEGQKGREKKGCWDKDPLNEMVGKIKLPFKDVSSQHNDYLYCLKRRCSGSVLPKKYSLKKLVKKINKDNIHPLLDWGPPVGGEML